MSANSFSDLIAKLASDGPVKQEPSNRRVRGLIGGEWAFDTLGAQLVWEHQYFPYFYIPLSAIEKGPGVFTKGSSGGKGYWISSLQIGGKDVEFAAFEQGPLAGLVKLARDGVDTWFGEDEQLYGTHPRDPYHRIETLASSREVRIEIDGVVVARSTNSVFLYETRLRPRYYLSPTSIIDRKSLIPSDTKTVCPYKGEASYYHVKVGDKLVKDAIWYYPIPVVESQTIQNRLCFYNEKVDVFIDGVKEQK